MEVCLLLWIDIAGHVLILNEKASYVFYYYKKHNSFGYSNRIRSDYNELYLYRSRSRPVFIFYYIL